jgi:hypothetical protein
MELVKCCFVLALNMASFTEVRTHIENICSVADSCEGGNKSSESIRGGEFLCQLGDFELPTKDSAPWS